MKSEEFLASCLLISFVLNQLAIEGKAPLRYREDDGTGRESRLNRTAKMRGLEELAETDKVLTMTDFARQHNLTVFQISMILRASPQFSARSVMVIFLNPCIDRIKARTSFTAACDVSSFAASE